MIRSWVEDNGLKFKRGGHVENSTDSGWEGALVRCYYFGVSQYRWFNVDTRGLQANEIFLPKFKSILTNLTSQANVALADFEVSKTSMTQVSTMGVQTQWTNLWDAMKMRNGYNRSTRIKNANQEGSQEARNWHTSAGIPFKCSSSSTWYNVQLWSFKLGKTRSSSSLSSSPLKCWAEMECNGNTSRHARGGNCDGERKPKLKQDKYLAGHWLTNKTPLWPAFIHVPVPQLTSTRMMRSPCLASLNPQFWILNSWLFLLHMLPLRAHYTLTARFPDLATLPK